MRDVTTLIARAGAMRAGVIVRGEEGTGRQVVARAIHEHQCAIGAAFVAVDCAAYDADELETVLFGAAERSRADAASDKGRSGSRHGPDAIRDLERVSRGSRLHDALNGTLYIRNVAEAPTRVQGRLARVLRDREAVLAETGALIGLDVRPVASVDGTIERALQEGRVRDDLYRRLSVITIDVPPLRSRREDVPALANYFVRQICAAIDVPPKTLSRSALSLLAALPWRGNADELRGLLQQVIGGVGGGRAIALDDLLAHVRLDGGAVVFANGGTLKQARARFEREYITTVLEHHQGRISEAAKALGIQRTNLYRKMRTLRVPRRRRV
jgi:two-component system nitrogen regulation response regulator NtrX